jgi:transcriptional regulator with XRE-family HTH domain
VTVAILLVVSAAPVSPFGARLREWRRRRGLSQLGLAVRVGSTARHVSFLETGRSRPSRQMVLRLGEALDVGLRESNRLLHAAGLPAAFPQADIASPDLAPYRAAIDRMLLAHEPYPAMVVDDGWNVLLANRACSALFGADVTGGNFVRDYLANPASTRAVVNWAEVAWAGLDRLRYQAGRAPFDEDLAALVALAGAALRDVARPATGEAGLTVCPRFRVGDEEVRTIAMVARFDPVAEVTLEGLRVELMYPEDEAAERFFRRSGRRRAPAAVGPGDEDARRRR